MTAAETRARSAERRDEGFLLGGAVVAVIGCLLATATPLVAGAPTAFVGSMVSSGLLGTVFAVQSLRLFRRDSAVALAPAVLTTLFGVWFMAAPLLYNVGFLATAGTQLAGLLTSVFATYMVVARIAPAR
ncbi:hypothetical protein [Halosegnis sp.]|uniref:hypothetical protein n=1 Tax=Halosegnis sp. TaxID=2864959 RepID=UPI0035D45582